MPILEKTTRFAAIALGILFIGLSLFGIFGAWLVDSKATDVVLKAFGLIETGVGVVNAGVARVDDLIATSRTEVRQASETITAAGEQAQANSPVLNALNERLETGLAPRIAQMQQVLAPVRDAVGTISNAVSLVNSVPMMADRALCDDAGLDHLQPSRRRPAPLGSSAAVRDQSGAQRRASAYRRLSA